ncbi:hypothetical protein F511_12261 [Dorcoceras hygrometricum]|uniref:Uncharacterized protein n=1 Tax=Dorcoceras hygrometricum TaxID=472368 RepID=A0A2Z7D7Y4_9LAMI|nr:hypothetical protein F511_12261 [Dorcoceras hygrometricum]
MVKRLATSPHDPLGITDSAFKNQLVMVSIQYGPFNTYIPIRSTTIDKSRVARDPITMHTSRRSNSDIAYVTSIDIHAQRRAVNPRQRSIDSYMHRDLTQSRHLMTPTESNSSVLLVQPDEGVSVLVVDRIGDYLPQSTEKSRVLVIPVGARHKCQQGIRFERPISENENRNHRAASLRGGDHHVARARHHRALAARWRLLRRALAARLVHGGQTNAHMLMAASLDASGANCCAAGRAPRATLDTISREDGRPLSTLPVAGHEVLREEGAPLCAGLGARLSPAGRHLRRAVAHDARWPRDVARGVVRCRRVFVVAAPPSPAAAPASLRRCRDGWSEFF